MDETDYLYDSVYEMDAPRCVDFNVSDISVNESIFDKRTVGERAENPFKDIGNLITQTQQLQNQFKAPGTPKNGSPLMTDITRRITRSAARKLNRTLTPEFTGTASHTSHSSTSGVGNECVAALSPYPEPIVYTTQSAAGSPALQIKSTAQKKHETNESPRFRVRQSVDAMPSPSRNLRSRKSTSSSVVDQTQLLVRSSRTDILATSKPRQPAAAHSGTPFKGKKSPLKQLRVRTKSHDNMSDKNQPYSLRGSRASDSGAGSGRDIGIRKSNKGTATADNKPASSLRSRTSSGGGATADYKTTTSTLRSRASSGGGATADHKTTSSLRSRTSSGGGATADHKTTSTLRGRTSSGGGATADYKTTSTLRSRTSSGGGATANHKPVSTLRGRTHSSGSNSAPVVNPPSTLRIRSSSQSSLQSEPSKPRSYPTFMSSTSDISPTLSRLMQPTESARLKMQSAKTNVSPLKRTSSSSANSKPPKLPRSTIPRTPNFARQLRSRITPLKTSEEIELERIERDKQQMESLRKMNEEGLKSISSSGKRGEKPPNLPTGKAPSQVKAKRSIADKMAVARPTAATRQRSADRALHIVDPIPRRDVYTRPTVTKTISPKLHTKLRERPTAIPTAEEREAMQLEEMKRFQFKAAPVDKKIFSGPIGVGQKELLPITEPLPLKLATDDRIAKHAEKRTAEQPAPEPLIKAQPVPKTGPVFKPMLDHKCTSAEPFTFEKKDEASRMKKAELLRKTEEEERKLREFKANPLPATPQPLAPKQIVAPTVPEPFKLRIDERGEVQQEKFRLKVAAEEARMLEGTVIQAKPADVLNKQPFVLKKAAPKITEPFKIELSSSRRAEERKEYERRKKEERAEALELEAEMQKRRDEEERREMIVLRQQTIIKPAVIKQYRPVEIKQSDKPLTKPMSPHFSKR